MEQFGLPDNNVKGYPLGRIGDVVSDVHYGTSAKASDNGKYVLGYADKDAVVTKYVHAVFERSR